MFHWIRFIVTNQTVKTVKALHYKQTAICSTYVYSTPTFITEALHHIVNVCTTTEATFTIK